jgi:hypothetical protein
MQMADSDRGWRRWIVPRAGRFTLGQTVAARILALALGLGIGHAVWGSPGHRSISVSFDRMVYRPGDTIRFRVGASRTWQAQHRGSRLGFDQMCVDATRRGSPSPAALRLMREIRGGGLVLHDENNEFTFITDPRKTLHLGPGAHVLCLYNGDGILGAGAFALTG